MAADVPLPFVAQCLLQAPVIVESPNWMYPARRRATKTILTLGITSAGLTNLRLARAVIEEPDGLQLSLATLEDIAVANPAALAILAVAILAASLPGLRLVGRPPWQGVLGAKEPGDNLVECEPLFEKANEV